VRVGVEQVAAIVHLNLADRPDRTLANQVARLQPGRRPLIGVTSLTPFLASREHVARPTRSTAIGFWRRMASRRAPPRRHHFSVPLVPRAHVDEVWAFGVSIRESA
jgi:hypothetical protein